VAYTVESALKVSIRNFMNLSFVHASGQEMYSLYMAAFPGDTFILLYGTGSYLNVEVM